ncbi:MAG: oligosaccharide flippase family protein [Christensenellales bacterium]
MRKKKLFASVATVTVFGVFTRIISFLFKIYLSRALGAEAIGLYQMALSVFFLFASISASGIPLVLSRKTAEKMATDGRADFSLFSSALLLGSSIALSCVLVLTILNRHLVFLFSEPSAYPIFAVTVPALLSTTIYSVIRGFFWGKKEFTAFSATETVEEILRILFSVVFISGVISGVSGAYAVALAFTASDILIAAILFALFFFKGGRIVKPSSIKSILLPSLPVTAMRMFSSLMSTLIAFILPLRLISYGLSAAEATASYGRIAGMANPLLLAPNALIASLTIVLIPEMSANGAKKEFSLLNRHLNNGINFSFLISGVFMVAYIALGKEITSFLYADSVSGEYLQYAAYIMLPMCLMQLTQSALNSIGKEMSSFLNYLAGNVVMLFLIWLLPPRIGIYSVAVATFASFLISSILNVYSLRKAVGFDFGFIKYLVMVSLFIFPSAFMADCLYSITQGGAPIISLFFSAATGVGAYCLLCLCTDLVDVKGFIKLRKKPS